MVKNIPGTRRLTVGTGKGYDTEGFVAILRSMSATPHGAQNDTNRRPAMDGRTTRHPGYDLSGKVRKRIEEIFGWLKTVGTLRKVRYRGAEELSWYFTLAVALYDLVCMRNLGDRCRPMTGE